jgi:hypothetical protein
MKIGYQFRLLFTLVPILLYFVETFVTVPNFLFVHTLEIYFFNVIFANFFKSTMFATRASVAALSQLHHSLQFRQVQLLGGIATQNVSADRCLAAARRLSSQSQTATSMDACMQVYITCYKLTN